MYASVRKYYMFEIKQIISTIVMLRVVECFVRVIFEMARCHAAPSHEKQQDNDSSCFQEIPQRTSKMTVESRFYSKLSSFIQLTFETLLNDYPSIL